MRLSKKALSLNWDKSVFRIFQFSNYNTPFKSKNHLYLSKYQIFLHFVLFFNIYFFAQTFQKWLKEQHIIKEKVFPFGFLCPLAEIFQ